MSMGNGLNFHPELTMPRPHLRLAIRPHSHRPYCVRGDHEVKIGRYHASAKEAYQAIRSYCRDQYAATVRIFTPQSELWCEDELALDGTVRRTLPGGRKQVAPSKAWPD